ncbi:MAG: sodium:solute symporter family protein [Gemmatimonadetes bacterium]|nr:sodium:solute symporter family protein [Gemmatimonadota bacterium]
MTVNLQLLAILAYSLALAGLGIWLARRVRDASGFFVAGRRLGAGLTFSTFLAANIGAGSVIAASGLAYREGLSAWWWVGSAGIGSMLLGLWIGPRIWEIAKREGLLTTGDFLEYRYGQSVRTAVAVILWFAGLAALAAQLVAMSQILTWVLGAPTWLGAALGGALVVTYFATGGLLASAWVNMVQLVVLLGGMAVLVPVAMVRAGGWDKVVGSELAHGLPGFLNGEGSGWVLAALLVPAFMVSPGLLQKAFGARDKRSLRLGIVLQGVVLLLFACVPVALGLLARVHDPSLAGSAELAVPTVLTYGVPAAVGALALAAVFSAEVSSADAVLFMLTTSLSKDLYKRHLRPEASDRDLLRVARFTAAIAGAGAVLLAIANPSVVGQLTLFYSILSVSLFVPVLAGIYRSRFGTLEALATIAFGVAVLFIVRLSDLGDAHRLLDPALLGIAGSALAGALALGVRRLR